MSSERSERVETARSKPRRLRSATESLLAIVLGLEAFVLFLTTLVVFGLRVLDPLIAFVGGGAFILVLVALAGLQRHRWAVWAGAVAQAALIATGALIPIMFAIGAGFAALWLWCFLRARQLDRQRQEYLEQQTSDSNDAASAAEGDPS